MKSIPYRNFWENNDDIFNNAVAKTRAGANLNISKLSVQHRESQPPVKSAENFMIWTPWNFLEDKNFWLKKSRRAKFCLRIKIQTKFWLKKSGIQKNCMKKIGKQKTCLKTKFLSDYNGGKRRIFKFQTVFHTIWFHTITKGGEKVQQLSW